MLRCRTCKEDKELVPCVAVIDEYAEFNDPSYGTNRAAACLNFRTTWPSRPFCLLTPPQPGWYVDIPAEALADPNFITQMVTRYPEDSTNTSDWFSICGLGSLGSPRVPFLGKFLVQHATCGNKLKSDAFYLLPLYSQACSSIVLAVWLSQMSRLRITSS